MSLTVKNLSFEYGDKPVLRELNFTVERGEILVIKGSNGTGKTTLIKILARLLQPQAGSIWWENHHLAESEIAHDFLYLGHRNGLKTQLTAAENLSLLYNFSTQTLQQTLKAWQLDRFNHMPLSQLSAGQRRRVALMRLIPDHKTLWLLDEPFNLIDQDAKKMTVDLIEAHQKKGGIILMSDHENFLKSLDQAIFYRELFL